MNNPAQNLQTQFSEIDLLTGCCNLVNFSMEIEQNFGNHTLAPLTLITLDLKQLKNINRNKGFEHGDQILRWIGIALRDHLGTTVYRISGQHFAVVFVGGEPEAHNEKARNLFEKLNQQADQLELTIPVVSMAVIHFPGGNPVNPALIWKNLNEKMELVKTEQPFMIFEAESLTEQDARVSQAVELMAYRILGLGQMMNIAFRIAYTDPVGNLPNMIAAQRKLDLILAESATFHHPFTMFLVDGDDLKRYNYVGYAAGDQLIAQLSHVLQGAVRPGDFVGRWRFGDEFLILLPDTPLSEAVTLGENIRKAVQEASHNWLFPTTISMGVVQYPEQGLTVSELITKAETALSRAKANGKNQLIVAV